MLSANDINRDYTFTQAQNRLNTIQTSKLLSKYTESDSGTPKNKKTDVSDSNSHSVSVERNQTAANSNTSTIGGKNKAANNTNKPEFEDYSVFEEDDDSDFMYDGKVNSITTSFDALAAAVGASNDKVSKSQLVALLQSLVSDSSSDNADEIAFVKNLIAKFDTISGGSSYITSFANVNEIQDYETITTEQVTPPIDIRI